MQPKKLVLSRCIPFRNLVVNQTALFLSLAPSLEFMEISSIPSLTLLRQLVNLKVLYITGGFEWQLDNLNPGESALSEEIDRNAAAQGAPAQPMTIHTLHMRHCSHYSVNQNVFLDLHTLTYLDVSGCSQLTSDSLHGLPQLKKLNISSCSSMSWVALQNLQSLETLIMTECYGFQDQPGEDYYILSTLRCLSYFKPTRCAFLKSEKFFKVLATIDSLTCLDLSPRLDWHDWKEKHLLLLRKDVEINIGPSSWNIGSKLQKHFKRNLIVEARLFRHKFW
jgi:hypothetical protein